MSRLHNSKSHMLKMAKSVDIPENEELTESRHTLIDPSSIPTVLRRTCSFDHFHHDPRLETRVLVLYTGGTIGMVRNKQGVLEPCPHAMEKRIRCFPHLHDSEYSRCEFGISGDNPLILPDAQEKRRVVYTIYEYDPLLDSSNMTMDDWIHIAQDIKEAYELFDGFVVLHGTDTLAYTASALSFMLENLGKPVVITGSQIPIFETRSDGRDNFLGALIIAGIYCIPEVCVYFGHSLFRGNRTTKISTGRLNAFDSPNCPPLATVGIDIQVDYKGIFRPTSIESFQVHTSLNRNVGLLRVFPSITIETVRTFLTPPTQGVILQTYGSGNMPSNRGDLLMELKAASERGLIIVNCTQCNQGGVTVEYETGKALADAGVIPGSDMTPEAALSKLAYVLSKTNWNLKTKREKMQSNLRGEMTMYRRMKLQELSLIDAVARSLHLSTSEEVDHLRDLLAPSLLCAAAERNDILLMESVKNYGGDICSADYEGRTPLHVACREGKIKMVEYLLNNGASVHSIDRRGQTPLMEAIEFEHMDVIKLLRNCGAHLTVDSIKLAGLLGNAVANGNVELLKAYHLAGADVNVYDVTRRTPLHVAVEADRPACIRALRAMGANLSCRNLFGHTPQDIATALIKNHLITALQGILLEDTTDTN